MPLFDFSHLSFVDMVSDLIRSLVKLCLINLPCLYQYFISSFFCVLGPVSLAFMVLYLLSVLFASVFWIKNFVLRTKASSLPVNYRSL